MRCSCLVYVKLVEDEFADLPLTPWVIADGEFKSWRDKSEGAIASLPSIPSSALATPQQTTAISGGMAGQQFD